MKHHIILATIILLCVLFFSFTHPAYAGTQKKDCPEGAVCLDNPLGDIDSPQMFIGGVIKGILGVVGSLALAIFIYGGFLWMTAAGNAEQVTKGKNALIWATIGLIVIFTSYALVRFVIYDVIQAP